jgi:LEA14-like dessication related protein
MKTGTILLLAGAGLVAYEFQQLGTAAQTVQFQFAGVQINGLTNYNVQLLIQNISNISCSVNAMSGVINLNGNQIGNISDFNPVIIGARAQQIVNVALNPNLLSLPFEIQSLINNPGQPLNFEVNGNANVNGLILPFDLSKTIIV